MPVSFRAVMHKRTSDTERAGTVTFKYPASEAEDVDEVGRMTNAVLIVTVMRENEVKGLS